jgi:hypothetical protein
MDGKWLYLHAGGAVGGAGAVSGVNVRLSGTVGHHELRLPIGAEALVSAVSAGLRLADLGSKAISLPLLAATYRAVLGETDFAIHCPEKLAHSRANSRHCSLSATSPYRVAAPMSHATMQPQIASSVRLGTQPASQCCL